MKILLMIYIGTVRQVNIVGNQATEAIAFRVIRNTFSWQHNSNLGKRSPFHEEATPTKNWLDMTLGKLFIDPMENEPGCESGVPKPISTVYTLETPNKTADCPRVRV